MLREGAPADLQDYVEYQRGIEFDRQAEVVAEQLARLYLRRCSDQRKLALPQELKDGNVLRANENQKTELQ